MTKKTLYSLALSGGVIGIVAAFLQTLEKLTLIHDSHTVLYCSINSVFNCNNVLNAWQSSVFGFPNSILCLFLFTVFSSIALAGLCSSGLAKGLRLSMQILTLLTLGFALWFLWESIYRINAVCIFCVACYAGLLIVNGAWLRINADDLPLGGAALRSLRLAIDKNLDVLIWLIMALALFFTILLKFY